MRRPWLGSLSAPGRWAAPQVETMRGAFWKTSARDRAEQLSVEELDGASISWSDDVFLRHERLV